MNSFIINTNDNPKQNKEELKQSTSYVLMADRSHCFSHKTQQEFDVAADFMV